MHQKIPSALTWTASIPNYQCSEECEAEEPSAREEATHCHPATQPNLQLPQGIYALANAYIETNLSKTDLEIAAIKREG
jgi:hypothetical protein